MPSAPLSTLSRSISGVKDVKIVNDIDTTKVEGKGQGIVKSKFGDEVIYKNIDFYTSSLSLVRLMKPDAATQVTRVEAESKVFRGLTVLFVLAVVYLLGKIFYDHFVNWQSLSLMAVASVAAIYLSFNRFSRLRREKARQTGRPPPDLEQPKM